MFAFPMARPRVLAALRQFFGASLLALAPVVGTVPLAGAGVLEVTGPPGMPGGPAPPTIPWFDVGVSQLGSILPAPAGDIVYLRKFVDDGYAIDRYDVAARQFLAPLVATTGDGWGIYSPPGLGVGILPGIDISPDGKTIATVRGNALPTGQSSVRLIDTATGAMHVLDATGTLTPGEDPGQTFDVAFLDNETVLLLSPRFRAVNLNTSAVTKFGGVGNALTLTPGAGHEKVAIWDYSLGAPHEESRFLDSDTQLIDAPSLPGLRHGVAFDRHGGLAIPGNTFTKFFGADYALKDELKVLNQFPEAMIFSPVSDVVYIATSNGFTVYLHAFDSNTFQYLAQFDYLLDSQSSVETELFISDDGRTLFARTDQGFRVYDVSVFAVPEPSSAASAAAMLASAPVVRNLRRRLTNV